MKKIILGIILVMAFIIMPKDAFAEEDVTIYLFRSTQCQHCEAALDYLNNHKEDIPDGVKLVTYQVYKHAANQKVLETIEKDLKFKDDDIGSVPLFMVGEKYVFGYAGPADAKKVFELAKEAKNDSSYHDYVGETIKELGVKAESMTLSQIFSEPNKIVTIIVFCVFGAIVVGFGAMIIFSRRS